MLEWTLFVCTPHMNTQKCKVHSNIGARLSPTGWSYTPYLPKSDPKPPLYPMTPCCPAEKHRDADRPGGWCQLGHVGANRRPIGTASSSTMPMASPASLAAPPIARHCTPDDYSDDCRESTIRVCAEVDTWASVDRSGPLRAG